MKSPNFFIVGAPRAGTTSLANYLKDHPEVFLTEPKEPNYFTRDHFNQTHLKYVPEYMKSYTAYMKLYSQASEKHRAVGEATTSTLRSSKAIEEISRLYPSAKIIVSLRDPVRMMESFHAHKIYEGRETELDFERAWRMVEKRKAGNSLPKNLPVKGCLFYTDIGKLGQQVSVLLMHFNKKQVKFILFDDLQRNPEEVYHQTLSFLGVSGDDRNSFPVFNQRRSFRYAWVNSLFSKCPSTIWKVNMGINKSLNIRSTGIRKFAHKYLANDNGNSAISESFRRELMEYYREDVMLLSEIVGRDLGKWLK